MKKNNAFNILICLFLFLSGCGYTAKAYNLPSSIKSVYIQTLKNNTEEPNLENELKTKLVAVFQNDGNLTIASNDQADAQIKGQIVAYTRQAMRYASDASVQEYRLNITVNFEFIDLSSGKPIVKADNFSGNASYYLSGANAKSESNARAEALDNLSRLMLNKIITLW
ncbi:MAG: LptE family protein [Candidatus Omnitrophota bacterium]